MSNDRIITLVPNSNETVSFEDAFGEYSEARGGRKNRRSKRKAKKVAGKTKRKERRKKVVGLAKKSPGALRKARKNRLEAKSERKSIRRLTRQDRHDEKQDSRLQRKRKRSKEKAYRREISKPEEEEFEDPYLEDDYSDGFEYDNESEYDNYEDDYNDDYDSEYSDEYEDDYDDDFESEDYDYEDDSDYDDNYYADEDYDDYGDEDWGYFDANSSGVDGSISVNSRIQKISDKIEFNKEALSRETAKHKARPSNETKEKGRSIVKRIKWLEAKLDAFMSNSKDAEKHEHRRRHIGLAKVNSKRERQALHHRIKNGKTIVNNDLDSKISENKIVIPAKDEKSNATGINGIDLQDDFDAPKPKIVELTSNADGKVFVNNKVILPLVAGLVIGWAIMELKKSK